MRVGFILCASFLLVTSCLTRAELVTYGPISLGSDSPFGDGVVDTYDPTYGGQVVLETFGLRNGGGPGFEQTSVVNTFAFDVDPGYEITSIRVGQDAVNQSSIDPYSNPGPIAGRNYRIVLSVCSTSDICSSGVWNDEDVPPPGMTFPPLPSVPMVGAGTGILEVDAQTYNWGYAYEGAEAIFVRYKALNPVPEPSSIALLGTGIVGAVGAFRRKILR